MLTTFPLEPGDVVVMGSDGLWDNLSEREILACVEQVFHGTGYQRGMGAEKQGVLNARRGRWCPRRTKPRWISGGRRRTRSRRRKISTWCIPGEEG